jgi:tRNA pseudouridine55 synthase
MRVNEIEKNVFLLWKDVGYTPLQCIERMRAEGVISRASKATYAGRLDPAAEGLLIVLVDDMRFEKERFLNLDKVYEFSFVTGVITDTYDILGVPRIIVDTKTHPLLDVLQKTAQSIESLTSLPYPPYSSRTREGKPLWTLARAGEQFKLPYRDISISACSLSQSGIKKYEDIFQRVVMISYSVQGDFRQKEIISSWQSVQHKDEFVNISGLLSCSSGTYIRSVVHLIGEWWNTGAVTTQIIRTRIGDYSVKDIRD